MIQRINHHIDVNMARWLMVYLFLQPFLDVLTSVSIHYLNLPITIGVIVRMLALAVGMYYLVIVRRKNLALPYWIAIILIFGYLMIYVGYLLLTNQAIFHELKNTMRTFYFPLMLLVSSELYLRNDKEKLIIKRIDLIKIMMIYVLFIIVPVLFDVSLTSYTQGKIGELGLFNSTNEISAIISIMMPQFMLYLIDKQGNPLNIVKKIIVAVLTVAVIFILGTKSTVLALGIVVGCFIVKYMIEIVKKKRYQILMVMITGLVSVSIVGTVMLPKTNFYKNIEIHLDFLGITQISDVFTSFEFFDHFIFSSRLSFLADTHQQYTKSDTITKTMGLGYYDLENGSYVERKTIEMDFFDIFYWHGVLGFISYLAAIILAISLWFKQVKYQNQLAYGLSVGLIVILTTLVGHVIVAPAVSIFVCVLIIPDIEMIQNKS